MALKQPTTVLADSQQEKGLPSFNYKDRSSSHNLKGLVVGLSLAKPLVRNSAPSTYLFQSFTILMRGSSQPTPGFLTHIDIVN